MAATNATKQEKRGWRQNPDAVKRDILTVAIEEFAAHGLSGARIHSIASKTRSSKRMIYYYYGDKQGLYIRALEEAYAKVRAEESALDLGELSPRDALARLVAFTFDHHRSHPEFIRMVMIENIHQAENLVGSEVIRRLNLSAIEKLEDICRRGEAEGVFRPGLDPVSLHWQISAASFFNVSNRPTFSAIFGDAIFAEEAQIRLRDQIVDAILSAVDGRAGDQWREVRDQRCPHRPGKDDSAGL